jgi:hypothetical protein
MRKMLYAQAGDQQTAYSKGLVSGAAWMLLQDD